jgi:hypothetical protein
MYVSGRSPDLGLLKVLLATPLQWRVRGRFSLHFPILLRIEGTNSMNVWRELPVTNPFGQQKLSCEAGGDFFTRDVLGEFEMFGMAYL